jgi:hypothetical protein
MACRRCFHRQARKYTALCSACHWQVSLMQLALPRVPVTLRTRRHYVRQLAWYRLEAWRGYDSTDRTLQYASNMKWAAELAQEYGDGTTLELRARAGVSPPATGEGGQHDAG